MNLVNDTILSCKGFCTQIWLLTLKNLIIIWRSKSWFIGEIILSLLFFPIIVFVVAKSSVNISHPLSYEPVHITGTSEDWNIKANTLPRLNCQNNQTLSYVGNETMADSVIRGLEERFLNRITMEKFASINEMRDALKHELDETKNCGKYIGGLQFNEISSNPPKLDYRLLFPVRGISWHIGEFWQPEGPYEASADLKSIPGEPPYWQSGFLTIQFAIEQTFLKLIGKDINFDVFLQRLPSPAYRSSSVVAFLKATPTLWMLASLMIILHTTKNVVAEKNDGIKTYMLVMGLKPMAFYASHFVIGFMKIVLVFSLCAGAFSFGLKYISPSLFFVYSLLLGCCSILFSIFISTFVRRPSAAITTASVIWIVLIAAMHSINIPLNHIASAFLYSLNPIMAFNFGIQAASTFEATQMELGWLNMFSDGTNSFAFGYAFIMLIFDSIIISLLIYYLDSVIPTDDSPRKHPLFFIHAFASRDSQKNQAHGSDEVDSDETDANMESERCMNYDEADINIRRMTKTWTSTGQMAVDGLSFRAYRGQVSVLLGHNGAGKSTTFSVLSGAATCSSGDVLICGSSITSNTRVCQEKLGYCPQYNPLFPKLTVYQHLKLYAKLRVGTKLNFDLDQHIRALVKDVQLSGKLHTLADNLSGGMKRKLCVAISLVADSPVILLDEPTAGMDPEARNEISVLLERTKKNRTILLTTHYMDEADKLGDRIGIMVRGRLVCNGSSEFLKSRFGTGYVLSAVVSTSKVDRLPGSGEFDLLKDIVEGKDSFENVINKVLERIKKHAPGAYEEKSQYPQFSINIPVEYKKFFANMFEELETEADNLNVESYGLSFNTLEQVFLKVGEESEPHVGDESDTSKIHRYASELFNASQTKTSTVLLLIHQVLSLLQRCYLNALRNPARLMFTTLIVTLILIGMGVLQNNSHGWHSVQDLGLMVTESVSIPLQLQTVMPPIDFPFIVGKIPKAQLISIAESANLENALLSHAFDSPPLGIGAAVGQNKSTGNVFVLLLFNGAAHHAPPMTMLLLSNAILQKKPDSINLNLEVYFANKTDSAIELLSTVVSALAISIVIILAFSLITANFVIVLVEDRQRKFKHQMLLTKMSPVIYWLANTLWCSIIYVLFCLIVFIIFWIFNWMQNCRLHVIVYLVLYFWSCVPMVFVTSFLFTSPDFAFNALVIGNMVLSTFAIIVVQLLNLFLPAFVVSTVDYLGMIIFPSFALGKAIINLSLRCPLGYGVDIFNFSDMPAKLALAMFISGCVFWVVIFLLESKVLAMQLHQYISVFKDNIYGRVPLDETAEEDPDVTKERDRLQHIPDENMALTVRGIYKYYGRFCAVRNLTFGIGLDDCFGLLGVNGAGKTTTFDMITGISYPNKGTATIGGVNIIDAPVIGYCPQFDSLPFDLTPRETLLMLARISGFIDATERVEKVLWCIRMKKEANKQIRYCSGGQKRRVSIGVTMMSRTRLIMLDEPTAGIDPRTRRHIWNLLQAVRQQNVALMLTSHSMDECEALCSRIGFMNRGSLISIGTSQHLKSRYGNSFMLTFTIENPNPATFHFLNTLIVKEFKALPTPDASSMKTLHWEVPRVVDEVNVSWSQMFRKAQTIADSYTATAHLPPGSETPLIKDYSITQNSLEQVFLRLAEVNESPRTSFHRNRHGEDMCYSTTLLSQPNTSCSSLLHTRPTSSDL